MKQTVQAEIQGKTITIETGWMAKQANGAVVVRGGDTVVLVTAVAAQKPREDQSFFPLTVNYQEKAYAGGKIPGGFFKREGRPSENETLTSRLIDRPIRPLFPDYFLNETQIMATVLSADRDYDPGILSMIGASAALTISDIPFLGPIASVRVGRVDSTFLCNPTFEELEKSDLDIVVAGSSDAVIMVEGGASVVSEQDMLNAIFHGHESIKAIIAAQEELRERSGLPKMELEAPVRDEDLEKRVNELAYAKIKEAVRIKTKMDRKARLAEIKEETIAALQQDFEERDGEIAEFLGELEYRIVREHIAKDGERIDGRDTRTVRKITSEVGLLPRAWFRAVYSGRNPIHRCDYPRHQRR